ncbi:MAG: hypothetical protein ACUVWN_10945 [bacterium]
MKLISFSIITLLISIAFMDSVSLVSASAIGEEEQKEVVGLFGSLLAPSIFSTARTERLSASIYGGVITGEGEVPDFDGSIKDSIDSLQVYVSGRLGRFGATLGFGQGNEFEFSQPFIISVDYKLGLPELIPFINMAIDGQYSMIYLPNEKIIKVSAPGFGVASVNGIISAKLLFFFEPYVSATFNYIYLDSEDEFIKVWKAIPKLGLKLNIIPVVNIGTEISFIKNKYIDSSWVWNMGASVKF